MAVIVAVFAAPATAAVASPPAVDQYTQHLPTANGSGAPGETPPVARLNLLPSKTQAALSGRQGELLAQIATARGLGAPALDTSASNDGSAGQGARRGIVTVVTDTAGTGASLALIGALAVIAVPGAWNRFRRRRSPDQLL